MRLSFIPDFPLVLEFYALAGAFCTWKYPVCRGSSELGIPQSRNTSKWSRFLPKFIALPLPSSCSIANICKPLISTNQPLDRDPTLARAHRNNLFNSLNFSYLQ